MGITTMQLLLWLILTFLSWLTGSTASSRTEWRVQVVETGVGRTSHQVPVVITWHLQITNRPESAGRITYEAVNSGALPYAKLGYARLTTQGKLNRNLDINVVLDPGQQAHWETALVLNTSTVYQIETSPILEGFWTRATLESKHYFEFSFPAFSFPVLQPQDYTTWLDGDQRFETVEVEETSTYSPYHVVRLCQNTKHTENQCLHLATERDMSKGLQHIQIPGSHQHEVLGCSSDQDWRPSVVSSETVLLAGSPQGLFVRSVFSNTWNYIGPYCVKRFEVAKQHDAYHLSQVDDTILAILGTGRQKISTHLLGIHVVESSFNVPNLTRIESEHTLSGSVPYKLIVQNILLDQYGLGNSTALSAAQSVAAPMSALVLSQSYNNTLLHVHRVYFGDLMEDKQNKKLVRVIQVPCTPSVDSKTLYHRFGIAWHEGEEATKVQRHIGVNINCADQGYHHLQSSFRIQESAYVSATVYVYGSMFLVSYNFGHTFHQVAPVQFGFFVRDPIVQLTSCSMSGRVFLRTVSGAIWGCVHQCDQLHLLRVPNHSLHIHDTIGLTLSENSGLHQLNIYSYREVAGEGIMKQLSVAHQVVSLSDDVQHGFRESLKKQIEPHTRKLCPVRSTDIYFPDGTEFTRSIRGQSTWHLRPYPLDLFFEMGSVFQFLIAFDFDETIANEILREIQNEFTLEISMSGATPSSVSIQVEREYVIVDRILVFNVTISNIVASNEQPIGSVNLLKVRPAYFGTGLMSQHQEANENLEQVITDKICNGAGSCDITQPVYECEWGGYSLSSSQDQTGLPFKGIDFVLRTGCPPGRRIVFNATMSKKPLEGCEDTDDIPCFYFDNEFEPVFMLYDGVTGTAERFTGKLDLDIIGAGNSLNETKYYTPEEQALVRNKIANFADNNSRLTWICWPGSPCSGVAPKFPDTPEYYFVFRASSQQVREGEPSYCRYETTFTVRVHNLPLDANMVVAINVTTICLLTIAFSVFHKLQLSKRKRKDAQEALGRISNQMNVKKEN